jgi:hypothetical protein
MQFDHRRYKTTRSAAIGQHTPDNKRKHTLFGIDMPLFRISPACCTRKAGMNGRRGSGSQTFVARRH